MLLLGTIGMTFGLMVDSRTTELAMLTSLCGLTDRNLWSMAQLHWALLPWMHIGMWVGGLATIPFLRVVQPTLHTQYCAQLAQNIACSAWMTAGMSAGIFLFEFVALQFDERNPLAMVSGMYAGMVSGMATSVAIYRSCIDYRSLVRRNTRKNRAGKKSSNLSRLNPAAASSRAT